MVWRGSCQQKEGGTKGSFAQHFRNISTGRASSPPAELAPLLPAYGSPLERGENVRPVGGRERQFVHRKLEVAAGLEPAKTGFADQRLDHFGIATVKASAGHRLTCNVSASHRFHEAPKLRRFPKHISQNWKEEGPP